MSAEDLDKTIRDGLGLRWAFMGPFETIELNAPGGIPDYCARYGAAFSALRRRAGRRPSVWGKDNVGARGRELGPLALAEQIARQAALARRAPRRAGGAQESPQSQSPALSSRACAAISHHCSDASRMSDPATSADDRGDPMATAKSSSPAPSRARSTRPRCRRICRSRPRRSPMPRSARRRPARRWCTCTRATPRTASPDQSPEAFAPFLKVHQAALATCVINITTGGAPTMPIEERVQPCARLQARGRVASTWAR